jgi:O-acetyl-ADP-ribose deacetylase (regulator of RNase III)
MEEIPQPMEHVYIEQVLKYPGDLVHPDFKAIKEGNVLRFDIHADFNVIVWNQNIFESGAQVIVNAANTHLGGGGGIDGAIHRAGGEPYAEAHRALQSKYDSKYVEGYAAMIDSGLLKETYNIDNVIVVAGPQGESTPEKEDQLYSCYYNSLILAHANKRNSIAFPSISTGIFGFPKDRAAHISLRAISDFIKEYPDTTLKTISIHFLTDEEFVFYMDAAK